MKVSEKNELILKIIEAIVMLVGYILAITSGADVAVNAFVFVTPSFIEGLRGIDAKVTRTRIVNIICVIISSIVFVLALAGSKLMGQTTLAIILCVGMLIVPFKNGYDIYNIVHKKG